MNNINLNELLSSGTPAVKRTATITRNSDAISIKMTCYDGKKIYRMTLSNTLYQKLGNPTDVQLFFNEKHRKVLLGRKIQGCKDNFHIIGMNGKYPSPAVNSRDLLKDFISKFGIDFSQNHNQIFDDIQIDAHSGMPLAIISIVNK